MMNLLECYKNIVEECIEGCEGDCRSYNDGNCECLSGKVLKALIKLKEYEDAEEQGLLLRLPCKVGEKVYCFWTTYNFGLGVPEHKVIEEEFELAMAEDFGKTVFLTKEEAEQALEMKGEQGWIGKKRAD